MARTATPKRSERKSSRKILGLPIEGTHDLAQALVEAKPAKATKAKTPKEPKTPALFMGKVVASRVLSRPMTEFKNCAATCWLLISEQEGIYYSANSYNGNTPKLSWKPEDYRYDLTDKARKLIEKKIEEQGYTELDPDQFPEWVTTAAPAKRSRKSK